MKGKQQDFRTEKYIRYGIRKYSFGAASVAIAAGLMFLGNGAVSATEVQNAETVVATTPAEKTDQGTAEAKPETTKAEETKPEVKAQEAKKVNKAILEASIATLESKLSTAKYADATVVSSAKEVLATAKATLAKLDASQADVDAQAETVSALSTVVTESNTAGFDKKQAAEKEAAKAEAEKKATPAETALSVAKTALTQVSSEAEVTNKLAETELAKADVKEENKAAVTAAVAKNQAVLTETKALLADKSVTKEQVDAQLERLNESILAVYNELKNAGIGRDGKFAVNLVVAQTTALKDASTETGKKWLEDHGYSSLADIPILNKGKDDKAIQNLGKQIQWLDFTDKNDWTDLKSNGQLQVGSVFKKQLIPGYIVKLTVKELKPFHATEVYKKRVAGTANEDTYDANAENVFKNANGIGGSAQTTWSHIKNAGLDSTPHKTTIAGTNDSAQQKTGIIGGVVFKVEATYNGKETKPGIVMTTGEDVGEKESEIYTTNGTPWNLVAMLGNEQEVNPYDPITSTRMDNVTGPQLFTNASVGLQKALANKLFATPDAATAGLGSQVFGGYQDSNGQRTQRATPIVATAGATEVGMFMISGGAQSSMIGIKLSDFGDLPESYGEAEHFIRTEAVNYKTNGVEEVQQPYLGKVKADPEAVNGERVRGKGSDDATDNADEGVDQLVAADNVVNNKDTGEPEVHLIKGADNTYKVKVIASANGNDKYTGTVEPAYVRGFIDFNGNGKFDKGEESSIAEVRGENQEVELTFTNTQIIDTSKDVANFRVRIAKDQKQIENPIGIAYTGEVEDNQIQISHPPRGDYEETTGKQGEKQNIGIEFINRVEADASELGSNNGKTTFNAYGKINYTEQRNSISLASTKKVQTEGVMIVDPNGNLVKSYTKVGQGTYEVTDTGITFTPDANFVGKADGIVLRAVDTNGQSTGWTALTDQNGLKNINDGTHTTTTKTMDAVYIPTVTPKEITADPEKSTDIQGKAQTKTPKFTIDVDKDGNGTTPDPVTPSAQYPAKLIDPKTKAEVNSVTVEGEGTYTINPTTGEVTFQPLPTFKGTATGVDVTLTAPVGRNKEGQDVTAKATTKYTPTVTAVEPTAKPTDSAGVQGETQKGTPTFTAGNAEVPIKEDSHKLLDKEGNEVQPGQTTPAYAEDGVTEVGTYSINPTTGEVTFTPTDKTYTGKVTPAKVQAEDKNGTKVNTTYTPHIVGVTPTATPAESSGIQGQPQDGTVSFTKGETTIEGEKKSVPIKANSAVLLDASGNPVTAGAPVDALDPEGNKVGEYTIDPATNKVTFTPTNKEYKGKVQPAKVQAEDENGTKVKTTYTPHIVGVVPTAEPATSTDIQGVEQSKEVTFTPGKTEINGTEKTVAIDTTSFKLLDENENAVDSVPAKNPAGDVIGTYTLKVVDGKVNAVFTPTDKTYAGEVEPVTIQAKDTNGTVVKTTYTPSITPVEPSGTPTTSEGIQGAKQEGTPSFTPGDERIPMKIDADQPAKLVNPETGKPIDDTTIPAKDNDGNTVGTYTIEPTTGKVTFTPNKDFTGTPVAATVQAKDANGTPTTATYEPTVKPVTPTGSDTVTEDVQGSIQKGKPTFEGGTVTVNGEEKTVAIDEDKPAKLVDPKTGDPVESVTIDGEGTYTVTPDGIVTFTPEKNFTGKGTGVTVQREDKNATPVTAKYTPVVKPATPTSSDVITTNVQGAIQEGTPTFTGGKVTINGQEKTVAIDEAVKPKFDDGTTEKVVPNEGTYTIDENGKVTFTPEKTFTGQAAGVTVKRVDKNGTPVTAKYTPVVIPVSPTSKDAESEGPKGQSQEGTPTFTGGKVTLNGKEVPVAIDENVKPKFDDGTTEKVVPNEGTYTIDENGKVTFTPEPNFVGKATGVTVKRVDKNGTPVTAKYTPTVRPDTRFVVIEKDGKETDLLPSKDGAKPSEPIPGYNVVRTEIDEKGNTKHIYEKVKTSFKDKEGNEIPKYPSEPGTVDKKDIPEYRFVETKKLPNGDTEHIYEKVKTSFKDKEGNEIPKYPSEPGTVDKKDIPEYRFVETKKLPNGDTEHIYERVVAPTPTPTPTPTPFEYKVITTFVDENGVLIIPDENGSHPGKPLENYELVRTETDANGNVRNVYRKIQSQKPVQPVEPATPAMPEQPAKPEVPATPVQPTAVKEAEGKRELPNTGTEDNASLAALGLLGVLSGFGLVARKKKED